MYSAEGIEGGKSSNYQAAGVEKEVKITEVAELESSDGIPRIQLKTVNGKGQPSVSKKLNLNTEIKPGNQTSAWVMSARYLKNVLASMGYNSDEQNAALKANSVAELMKNLTKALVNDKPIEGLFSSREYYKTDGTIGKAIEMYITAPYGSNLLVYDVNNTKHCEKVAAKTETNPF